MESTGLEAFKANKILPTVAGLADCKDFGKAANMMLGIVNPHYFDIPEYYTYDIKVLKGNARFLQVTINRNGVSNGICPLLFIGQISKFSELPLPNNKSELEKVYTLLRNIKQKSLIPKKSSSVFFSFSKTINNFKKLFKHY